jgi:light-regulated signal transduction histidine kinase (bacteriophytochrome)
MEISTTVLTHCQARPDHPWQAATGEVEQQVRERTAELESANRELEAFSYTVSHDLQAPLRSIRGFSEALLQDYGGRLDERGTSYLHHIHEASRQLSQLIQDLMALGLIDKGELCARRVDLSALAEEVMAELQAVEPQRQVEVSIAPGLAALGNGGLLRIALVNLLSNAWKFTRHQPRPRIELGAVLAAGARPFFVRDNGAGFSMDQVDRLFGVFQRLHSAEDYPGTGIGLATVKRILRRHGGKVWAKGQPGQGATFYFTLPQP